MVNFVAKWHLIWAQSIQEVKPKILILILVSVLDNWLCPARARGALYSFKWEPFDGFGQTWS